MSKYLKWGLQAALALAVMAFAWNLRMKAVAELPPDFDEDDYLRAAQIFKGIINEGDWEALSETNPTPEHPPLMKIMYGFVISSLENANLIPERPTTAPPDQNLPQPHLETARTSSAVVNTILTGILAILNPVAGVFLAIHTFTIKYTSQVMLEALPMLTSALVILAYERSRVWENGKFSFWLQLSALMLGVTASGKYIYCVVGFAVLIHWLGYQLKERGRKNLLKNLGMMALWGITSIAFFILSNPYLWSDTLIRLQETISFHGNYATTASEVNNAGYPIWQPFVWLFGSVPWHYGVFQFSLDLLITIFAIFGFREMSRKRPVFSVWLVTALVFLLIWPTKWAQYILILMFPWCFSAAEGVRIMIFDPSLEFLSKLRQRGLNGLIRKPNLSALTRNQRPFWWLLPGVILVTLITYFPLLYQAGMALTDFAGRAIRDGLSGGVWRALQEGLSGDVEPIVEFMNNTVEYAGTTLISGVLNDSASIIFFNIMWTVLAVGLQMGLGVGIALLLNQKGLKLKRFWQTLFILPWAIPEFIGALSWMQLLHPENGWFALAGGTASFSTTNGNPMAAAVAQWTNDPLIALGVLLLAGMWLGFPLMMLATSAGLKMIPKEVNDAAAIDGANAWQRFRTITFPLLLPLLAPVIILRAVSAFNQFYLFYVLNPPFGMYTLASISFFIFDGQALYAVSAVINLLTVVILVVMLLWFNRMTRADRGVEYV